MNIVSIDPDLTASGVAVFQNGVLTELLKLNLPDLVGFVKNKFDAGFTIVIEDLSGDTFLYSRNAKGSKRASVKIAVNVGQVKGTFQQITVFFDFNDITYHLIKPLKGTYKVAKNDKVFFNRLLKWAGSSNQDTRDAALIGLHFINANTTRY